MEDVKWVFWQGIFKEAEHEVAADNKDSLFSIVTKMPKIMQHVDMIVVNVVVNVQSECFCWYIRCDALLSPPIIHPFDQYLL